jgi:hypothetical protein
VRLLSTQPTNREAVAMQFMVFASRHYDPNQQPTVVFLSDFNALEADAEHAV